jgi:hypothetical protein
MKDEPKSAAPQVGFLRMMRAPELMDLVISEPKRFRLATIAARCALNGFDVRFAPATSDKETRAKPVSARCEAGNVRIVRGLWNDEFLRVLENCPAAKHDDEVDALSGAHSLLSSQTGAMAAIVEKHGSERETSLGGLGRHTRGFDWPDDHPFRPHGSSRYPLL